jgi:hypothetical protein
VTLEIKLAEFYVDVIGIWSEDGTTTIFEEEKEEEGEGEGEKGDAKEADEEEGDDE